MTFAVLPLLSLRAVRVCVCFPSEPGCVCLDGERALRALTSGRDTIPLSSEERGELLDEIAQVEGFSRSDFEHVPDGELAGGVLDAWTSFARDKGLIE